MMKKDYNNQEHRELLEYHDYLWKQGKFLMKESREDYLKLLGYSTMVYTQLNWEIQDQYLEIFKKFLSHRISSVEFCEILEQKRDLNSMLSHTLQFDVIHEKAANFTDFLDNLSISCYYISDDENELRKEINETYLQIKKFLE
jgi:transcriptional regulator of heat shock response